MSGRHTLDCPITIHVRAGGAEGYFTLRGFLGKDPVGTRLLMEQVVKAAVRPSTRPRITVPVSTGDSGITVPTP